MGKVLMKGNEAIGEAAIRAGCLNYFAYPITPQSEVAEYLSRRMDEVGGVFLQGESEVAVGYCTLYGDMSGGLAVLSDVPKTVVYELSRRINESAGRPLIPVRTIEKPPSAELKEDQCDQDTLPPYETLDPILESYVEQEKAVEEIVALGFDRPTVEQIARMVDTSEYKRKQSPVGIKVTSRAFGTGRRMPIAARYR